MQAVIAAIRALPTEKPAADQPAHPQPFITISRQVGADTLDALIQPIAEEFGEGNQRLARWFSDLGDDMLDNLILFALAPGQPNPDGAPPRESIETRAFVFF